MFPRPSTAWESSIIVRLTGAMPVGPDTALGIPRYQFGQLPLARGLIVAQDIHAAIVGLHPKVPIIGGAPSIDNLHYVDVAIAKVEGTRLLLATMASVTLNAKLYRRLLGKSQRPRFPVWCRRSPAFATRRSTYPTLERE